MCDNQPKNISLYLIWTVCLYLRSESTPLILLYVNVNAPNLYIIHFLQSNGSLSTWSSCQHRRMHIGFIDVLGCYAYKGDV